MIDNGRDLIDRMRGNNQRKGLCSVFSKGSIELSRWFASARLSVRQERRQKAFDASARMFFKELRNGRQGSHLLSHPFRKNLPVIFVSGIELGTKVIMMRIFSTEASGNNSFLGKKFDRGYRHP